MLGGCYAKIAIFLVCTLALAACGPAGGLVSRDDVEQQGWRNFQTAVAEKDRGYDIYWLGRGFQAGARTYRGPEALDASDPGGALDGAGLVASYPGDVGTVNLILYSREAWSRHEAAIARGAQPHLDVKPVDIHGWPAELKTNYYRPGYVAARILVVDRGSTVIEITTGSVVPRTPGPEPNPLIDEQTFLTAMQHLRPYPQ